jgi:hypothetical protein
MSDNLSNDLEKFKLQYYSDNKKNAVFKTTQKTDLANRVCDQFGLDELFVRAAFIIPNTNKIYVNYPILKLFTNPSNYEQFVNYTQSLFLKCLKSHSGYECHLNLDTLTITAVERHKKLIEIFARDPSQHGGVEFLTYVSKVFIYNTPSLIDNIIKLFAAILEPDLLSRVTRYNKAETPLKLSELTR